MTVKSSDTTDSIIPPVAPAATQPSQRQQNEANALSESMDVLLRQLAAYELALAKETTLSGRMADLMRQQAEFETLKRDYCARFMQMNETLTSTQAFCTSDANRPVLLREKLIANFKQTRAKLNAVGHMLVYCHTWVVRNSEFTQLN